jgi:hypothetical protein
MVGEARQNPLRGRIITFWYALVEQKASEETIYRAEIRRLLTTVSETGRKKGNFSK